MHVFLRVQHREWDQVLGPQLVPAWGRDTGGVRSRMSWRARVLFLDAQRQGGEVLVEEVGQGEIAFLERVQLWSEVLWGHR